MLLVAVLGVIGIMAVQWVPVNKAYLTEQAIKSALTGKTLKHKAFTTSLSMQELSYLDMALGVMVQPQFDAERNVYLQCSKELCSPSFVWSLRKVSNLRFTSDKNAPQRLTLKTTSVTDKVMKADVRFSATIPGKKAMTWAVKHKMVRWLSILPPLLAIFFALLTRQILLSLFLSLFLGVVFLFDGSIGVAIKETAVTYIWKRSFYREFSFSIILFTLSLIGMINVCSRNGGVRGLIEKLARYASGSRSSRLITALMGLVIFFDDYANSIMVGNTMRPLTDRYRVSREKLAYLVDSTAAPIAGVALISTWIGYEVGLLGDLAGNLGLTTSGYQLFLSSLPLRFYCWLSLVFVFVGILFNRDFGTMLKAERRAHETGQLLAEGATPMVNVDLQRVEPDDDVPHRWYNALIPVATVLVLGLGYILWDGGYFRGSSLSGAFGSANTPRAFLVASLAGSLVAILLSISQRLISLTESIRAWFTGARAMLFAVGILVFAWSMGALAKDLGTAHYLIAMLKGNLSPLWVPLLIFLIAAAISFATGTSWGTMGILLPTVAPLAYQLGGEFILVLSVGAVLDGSIFGDHCSPLSDTTLFSSAATSCDHIDHVRTQAPYAITVMSVAGIFGYLGVAMKFPLWICLTLAVVALVAIFLLVGQPTTLEEPTPST